MPSAPPSWPTSAGQPIARPTSSGRARGADIAFLIQIAEERSRAGRWAEAVPLYDRAIAMGTVTFKVWIQAGTAHLELDDEDGFRRVCQVLRDRHPATIHDRFVNAPLAGVLVLGPDGVGDDGKALGWIEPLPAAVETGRRALRRESLGIHGAVLDRLGRCRAAIDRIREGIALGDGQVTPEEAVFLAMAHFRIGDTALARALQARPWSDAPDGPSAEDRWTARGRRILRRAAARPILDPTLPADPFGP